MDKPRNPVQLSTTKEDGDEHNTFGKSSEDNGLVTDRSGSTGIPASGFSGFHSDETHTDCRTKGSEPNMYSTSHRSMSFC